MAKKVISPKEAVERISEVLDFLLELDGYEWDYYIDFNFDDEQKSVSITIKLRKINV